MPRLKDYPTREAWRKAYDKAYRAANKKKRAAYREANKEKIAAKVKAYAAANRDKIRAYNEEYRRTPEERARRVVATKAWQAARPGYGLAHMNGTRAKKRGCVSEVCPEMIALYALSQESTGLEVDHIIPLSEGGPHCFWNLQLMTKAEHRAKTDIDLGVSN